MDDFSACANAEPVPRLEQLERENADFRTWGIIEIATRNPNVAEYMTHWEARVKTAEAEVTTLRARLQTVEAETPDYDAGLLNNYGGGDVGWWQDYLRAEIGRANDHWREAIRNLEPRHD